LLRDQVAYARRIGKQVEFLVDPDDPDTVPRERFRDGMAAGRAADDDWLREYPGAARA
jgi:hypothetical protein